MGLFDAPLRLVYESFKMRHLYRNWVARVGYCLDTEQGYFFSLARYKLKYKMERGQGAGSN